MITAYLYASCSSCRKSESMLARSGTQFASRDYFKDRLTREELAAMLSGAGLTPADVLSRRSKVYVARQAEIDTLDDLALLELMVEEPTLLRRPIVIGEGEVIIGHDAGKLATMIERNDA